MSCVVTPGMNAGFVSQSQATKREAPDNIPGSSEALDLRKFSCFPLSDEKPAKKAPKRSLAATIERMEKHKILERKRYTQSDSF